MPEDPCRLFRGPARKYCEAGNPEAYPDAELPDAGPQPGKGPIGTLQEFVADLYNQLHTTMTESWDISLDADFLTAYEPMFYLALVAALFVWLGQSIPVILSREGAAGRFGKSTLIFFGLIMAGGVVPWLLYVGFGGVSELISAVSSSSGFTFKEMAKRVEDDGGLGAFIGGVAAAFCLGTLWLLSSLRGLIVVIGATTTALVAASCLRGYISDFARRWFRYMTVLLLFPVAIGLVLLAASVLPKDARTPMTDVMVLAVMVGVIVLLFQSTPVISSTIKATIDGMRGVPLEATVMQQRTAEEEAEHRARANRKRVRQLKRKETAARANA